MPNGTGVSPTRIGTQITESVVLGYKKTINTWEEAVQLVDEIMQSEMDILKNLYPNAKIGYRGSLARGTKDNGLPFDPTGWDVDAFIVNDDLLFHFDRSGFRNGNRIEEINRITDRMQRELIKISGYRKGTNDPKISFRVWSEREYIQTIQRDVYKLF